MPSKTGVKLSKNVTVTITAEGEREPYAYRARLIGVTSDGLALLEERDDSGIPKGWYPLASVRDSKSGRRLFPRLTEVSEEATEEYETARAIAGQTQESREEALALVFDNALPILRVRSVFAKSAVDAGWDPIAFERWAGKREWMPE